MGAPYFFEQICLETPTRLTENHPEEIKSDGHPNESEMASDGHSGASLLSNSSFLANSIADFPIYWSPHTVQDGQGVAKATSVREGASVHATVNRSPTPWVGSNSE